MGLRISTNIPSLNAQRNLATQQVRTQHSMAALSSGKRIVTAADDAAGLAISENIQSQVRGLKMARNNAFNAQSMIQVSEGGLNEVSNILIRLRELGIQAASDTVGETERGFLNTEAKQLIQEAGRIAKSTRFGNKVLLDGSGEQLEFHVGAFSGPENIVGFKLNANATPSALGFDSISVESKDSARDALNMVDSSLVQVGKLRADFGAVSSRLQTTISNLDIQHENLSAARSRISDADIAFETSELTSSSILQQASISVLSQANQVGAAALKLL